MGKLLFWLVVLFVAGLLFLLKVRRRDANAGKGKGKRRERQQSTTLQSVRCRQCGVFVPENQAVHRDGEDFCSWEHAEQWQQHRH